MSHDPADMPSTPSMPEPRGTAAERLSLGDAFALADREPATPDADPPVVDTAVTTLGATEIGLWQVEPGVLHDVEVDEVFLVLAGSGRVTFADGSVLPLAPGALVQLCEGDRTVWEITETLRKLYVALPG